MYEQIYNAVASVDDFVWGWGMIALLLERMCFLQSAQVLFNARQLQKGFRFPFQRK